LRPSCQKLPLVRRIRGKEAVLQHGFFVLCIDTISGVENNANTLRVVF